MRIVCWVLALAGAGVGWCGSAAAQLPNAPEARAALRGGDAAALLGGRPGGVSFGDGSFAARLSVRQKGTLAARDFVSPGNLIMMAASSGVANGPGWKAFGRRAEISVVGDATGEMVGTFLIPSLVGEDPRYRRLPHASVPRRVLHAISHTVMAQSDQGCSMPNYATLLTYPIAAELGNLYVPGGHGNARATTRRVLTGLASDPVSNLVTEFLPDVARRVNVRVIFVQRVVDMVTEGQDAP